MANTRSFARFRLVSDMTNAKKPNASKPTATLSQAPREKLRSVARSSTINTALQRSARTARPFNMPFNA